MVERSGYTVTLVDKRRLRTTLTHCGVSKRVDDVLVGLRFRVRDLDRRGDNLYDRAYDQTTREVLGRSLHRARSRTCGRDGRE